MDDNKISKLELEISARSDWSTKALEPDFGGLGPQDFVNISELCDSYMDIGIDADDAFIKIGELTGLDPALEFKLSPTYTTSLLGLYSTIGGLIASDREHNSLAPDEQFRREQTTDAFLAAQQAIRSSVEIEKEFRDAVRKLLD